MIAFVALFLWLVTVSTGLEVLWPRIAAGDHVTLMVLGTCVALVVLGHMVAGMLKPLSRPGALLIALSGWVFLGVTVLNGLHLTTI